jgi:hypothetical protein
MRRHLYKEGKLFHKVNNEWYPVPYAYDVNKRRDYLREVNEVLGHAVAGNVFQVALKSYTYDQWLKRLISLSRIASNAIGMHGCLHKSQQMSFMCGNATSNCSTRFRLIQ